MTAYSEVRIACLKPDYDLLIATYRNKVESIVKDTADNQRVLFDNVLPTLGRTIKNPDDEPTVVFGWKRIPWYQGIDPVIQAFTETMAEVFHSDDHPVSFARIERATGYFEEYTDDDDDRLTCHLSTAIIEQ